MPKYRSQNAILRIPLTREAAIVEMSEMNPILFRRDSPCLCHQNFLDTPDKWNTPHFLLGLGNEKINAPKMTWNVIKIDLPLDGENILGVVTINNLHDMITLIDNGTWTAI
jgi:hypothetical protein